MPTTMSFTGLLLLSLPALGFGWSNFAKEFRSFATSKYHAHPARFVTPQAVHEVTPGVPETATGWLAPQSDLGVIKRRWLKEKNTVAQTIGFIKEANASKINLWRNKQRTPSAVTAVTTVEELIDVAQAAAPDYKKFVLKVASAVPGAAFTAGPNDQYLIKGRASTERKIRSKMAQADDSISSVASRFSDALRSTIVVEHASQVRDVVIAMNRILSAEYPNAQVEFENKFAPRIQLPSGYVGVHSTMLFQHGDSGAAIIAETQIHLKSIFDATDECPKHYAHKFYEVERALIDPLPEEEVARIMELDGSLRGWGWGGNVPRNIQQVKRILQSVGMLSYHFGLNKSLASAATASSNEPTAVKEHRLRGGPTRRLLPVLESSLDSSVEEPLYHLKDGVVYRARLSEIGIGGKIEVLTKRGYWKDVRRSLRSGVNGFDDAFHFYTNPGSGGGGGGGGGSGIDSRGEAETLPPSPTAEELTAAAATNFQWQHWALKPLPDDLQRYFQQATLGVMEVGLADLVPTRAREKGIANANRFMWLAYYGRKARREPVSVRDNGDGTYTVLDGNSTYENARLNYWKRLRVRVVGAEGVENLERQSTEGVQNRQ